MTIPAYIRELREHIGHDLIMIGSAAGIICDDAGHILLHQRADNGLWGLPGGLQEPGETPAETVRREVYEETGLSIQPEHIVGLYDVQITYPNQDRIATINTTFACRVIGGNLQVTGDETLAVRYFPSDNLPANILPFHLLRIQDFVTTNSPSYKIHEEYALEAQTNYIQSLRQRVGPDYPLQLLGSVGLIFDESGQILMGLREDGQGWGLPGGAIEPGENPAETVIREVYEETGLHVLPERLIGVYGGDLFQSQHASWTGYFFQCRVVGGDLQADGTETLDLRYFPLDTLPQNMLKQHRLPIQHAWENRSPYF